MNKTAARPDPVSDDIPEELLLATCTHVLKRRSRWNGGVLAILLPPAARDRTDAHPEPPQW